jgi:hypothetical protein
MRHDFSYVEALHAKAHRARAEYIYGLLLAPVLKLIRRTR